MKRGCEVCAHVYRTTRGELFGETRVDDMGFKKNERLYICPFARCPLHEMDKYKNYGAYYTATKAENDRILKKAFNIKVRKAMKKKLKVETKLPKKFISSRKRWLIGCRDNQGFSIEDIAREFEISEEQAKEVVEEYRSMR